MRAFDVAAGAAVIALIGSLGTAAPAHAEDFGVALNGTYRAVSDGEWAKSSAGPHGQGGADVFIDQPTVIETWTVSTDCVSPIECTGTVTSDRGWTGTIRLDDFWYVDHEIPNWLPCPNGTFAPGHQKFILMGWDPARNERLFRQRDFLMGRNQTKAPSGACGANKPVVIELPVRVEKLS